MAKRTGLQKQNQKNRYAALVRAVLDAGPPENARMVEMEIHRMSMNGFGRMDILIMLYHMESRKSHKLDDRGKQYLKNEIDRLRESIYGIK